MFLFIQEFNEIYAFLRFLCCLQVCFNLNVKNQKLYIIPSITHQLRDQCGIPFTGRNCISNRSKADKFLLLIQKLVIANSSSY